MNSIRHLYRAMLAALACSMAAMTAQAAAGPISWNREWLDEVTLQWQLPAVGGTAYFDIADWTPSFAFDLASGTVATDGKFIYAGTGNPVSVYDMNGTFLKQVTITNLPDDVYRITSDGTNFYATNYERPGIFQIDFDKCEVVKVIPTRSEMYQITYIPTLDGGRGGFLCSNPVGGWLCAMDGSQIGEPVDYREVMGTGVYCNATAYLNGKFYIYTADAQNSENVYDRVAYEFDATTFKPTGKSFRLGDFVGQGGVTDRMSARNLFVYTDRSQRTYMMFIDYNGMTYRGTSVLVGESALTAGLSGYNLYRNNVKVNDAELGSRVYSFTDAGLAEDENYDYELRPVVGGKEGEPEAEARVKLPATTALPLVEDFSSYTVTREHEFLRLPGNYWTITPKLPEQKWRVSNVNGFSCIQFSYSTDLKYRQTLVSRPLTAPAGRNVKLSLGYAGNTYIYTLAETECMNIEYSLDGGESWLAVDQIRYKSNTALTHVEFDLTEKVAGKTFMLRFKGSGAEPDNDYNWQLTDIKVWDYVPCAVGGKVILSGASVAEGTHLTFVNRTTGVEYAADVAGDGTFAIDEIESGNYSVTVASAEYSYTVEDFTIDRSATNYRVDVPGGYFTGNNGMIDVKLWANVSKDVEVQLTNSGNAVADADVQLSFGGAGTGEAVGAGNITEAPRWNASAAFELPQTESGAFCYGGSIYTIVQNYSTPQLRRYSFSGAPSGEIITLTSVNALPNNIAAYVQADGKLYAVTVPKTWSTPAVPAYLIPVDLAAGTIDEPAKKALPSEIGGMSGIAFDAGEKVFYVRDSSNALYKVSLDGELLKKITLPEIGYYGLGFDGFSAGGPYLYMARSVTPAGVKVRQYSIAKEQFTQIEYDVNNTPESIFNNAAGMVMAGSPYVSASTLVKPGYYSLIVTQTLTARGPGSKAQCLVYPLFPYETWMSSTTGTDAVEPGRTKTVNLHFDSNGLDDKTVKQADVIVSASNFSEPMVIPVRLTVDYSSESEYPAVTSLSAKADDSYRVALSWEQPLTERNVSDYLIYRNGRLLAKNVDALSYTDEIPAYGRQTYSVTTVYSDGFRVASESVEIEVCDPSWGVPVANLSARVVARRNVKLAWDATPEIPDAFVDDFERYEPFDVDKIGDWTLIDGDRAWTYENNNIDFPNEGERMAGMVFNPSKTSPAASIELPEGSRQALAFFSGKTQLLANDNWLISPAFSMRRDGILRFEASTPYPNYGKEQLMVGYSVSGTDRDDFVWLDKVLSVESGWSEFVYDIPAETRHIAFRHLGIETFMLLIDNVYAGPVDNMTSVEGFNVYRDGQRLTDAVTAGSSYSDYGLADGDYRYSVETVYSNGARAQQSTDVLTIDTSVLKNAPRDLSLSTDDTALTLEWKAPELAASEQLRYDDGTVSDSFGGSETAYAMIAYDDADLRAYEGYSITNLHFHISDKVNEVVPQIYRDGRLVREGKAFVPEVGKYNDYIFDTPLLIERGHEYMVGYKALTDNGHYPLSHGAGPGVAGKSDVYSEDGVNWYSIFVLGKTSEFDINWNIAVDLEIVPDFITSAEAEIPSAAPVRVAAPRTEPVVCHSAAGNRNFASDDIVKFVGFNVYANGGKLNDAPVDKLSHSIGLPEADTDYYVSSVYSDGDEVNSETITYTYSGLNGVMQQLRIYPNPVKDNLYIEGTFDAFRLYSLDGNLICSGTAAQSGTTAVDMNACPSGVYLLTLTVGGKTETFRVIRI